MMPPKDSPDRLMWEFRWMIDHPEFEERPATMAEFLGPDYLNSESWVRQSIADILVEIFGDEVDADAISKYFYAMITGGIGIGKTTIASIVLPYLAHWCLCLKNPQEFFNIGPGSRIAFMQMSTSGRQAKETVFGDIKARIEHAPWFAKYPYDKKYKNQLRFEKNIWILPGDSAETTFEGYNILGGILDEADSHKVTDVKDYADQGFDTINSRIESRFARVPRPSGDKSFGFLLVIGQMKKGNGFASRKFEEFGKMDTAYATRLTIWESVGWDRFLKDDGVTRDSFWYNIERHEIVPTGVKDAIGTDKLIEIPNAYKQSFINNPEKALRDLAGIPPASGSPFISLTYKVTACRDRWIERYNRSSHFDIVEELRGPLNKHNQFADWFRCADPFKRVCHIDMAYSADGDALGLAMGHVPEMVEREGELKPHIVFDMLMRIHATAGNEIFLGDVRRIIYMLRDEYKFKIQFVSTDGFQSTDTRQQLEKKRIATELISVDRNLAPYEDLREAIYEDRLDFPEYLVKVNAEDLKLTEIAVKELIELVDNGKKVDHPERGSKDVADAMAGVCYTLMGDRTYHRRRKVMSGLGGVQGGPPQPAPGDPRWGDLGGMSAPLPPTGDPMQAPTWRPQQR